MNFLVFLQHRAQLKGAKAKSMTSFLLASHNRDKIAEIESIFRSELGDDIEFVSGIDPGEVVEDGDTIEENARIKAYAWLEYNPDSIILADDTGLFVDALDGAPGIFAARYAGENATYADNCTKLLQELKDVDDADRTARFSTCAIAIKKDANDIVSMGHVDGLITNEPRGESGFGYDPVFIPSDYGNEQTFSELGNNVKNMISHRARAFRALATGVKNASWL
jgi:XTP/dITP diphosphohydrolase